MHLKTFGVDLHQRGATRAAKKRRKNKTVRTLLGPIFGQYLDEHIPDQARGPPKDGPRCSNAVPKMRVQAIQDPQNPQKSGTCGPITPRPAQDMANLRNQGCAGPAQA